MSVEQLVIGDSPIKFRILKKQETVYIDFYDTKIIAGLALNRNQAHLLYLYLKEHLNV